MREVLPRAVENRLRLIIRAMAAVLALAVVALLVTLIVYLTDDDALLGNGTSRWASHAGDHGSFWLALALSVVATVALAAAARTGRVRTALGAVALGGLAVAASAVAFVAFSDY